MNASEEPTRPAGGAEEDRPSAVEPRPAADGHRSTVEPGPAAPQGPAPERTVPAERTGPAERTVPAERPAAEPEPVPSGGGKTAGVWIALILGAIVTVMLLIFVIQNNTPTTFQYFSTEFGLPLGVAMLLAAIAGALVMALVGSVRMVQMSWTIRKLRKQLEKVHRASR